MLKPRLIFFLHMVFLLVMGARVQRPLPETLAFFPLVLFPSFYFLEKQARLFLPLSLVLTGLTLGLLTARHFSLEVALFWVLLFGFFFCLVLYRRHWRGQLALQIEANGSLRQDLEELKRKHDSRLESLHHLEKQVGGLLDLFEIARDFNETLTLDVMTDILQKKVLPELPFTQAHLYLERALEEGGVSKGTTMIRSEGVFKLDEEPPLLSQEIQKHRNQSPKRLEGEPPQWFFTLVNEPFIYSGLLVEGAAKEDLAKFEVLAAYLGLQVKKIRLYETVRELSLRDGLTGVFVRRHFLERFEEELRRCLKYGLQLAVLMLDIDHFKRYNDEFGHLSGDAALKQVTVLLKENLRQVDIVARFGGEEFAAVLPETKLEGALEVAERIRSGIARHSFKMYQETTRVTVSIGISFYHGTEDTHFSGLSNSEIVFELIRRADKALYQAKEEGRNRVVLYKS